MADPPEPPSDPSGRGPGIIPGPRRSRGGVTSTLIAIASTIVVVALIVVLVPRTRGWEEARASFFDWDQFQASMPKVWDAFQLNIRIFLVVEGIVLVAALLLAVARGLPGPVFFPVRALAVVYSDVFRGIPTILLVLMLGFGIPALQIPGVPIDPVFWGAVALAIVYTAYVSEVYRAGIESVHPSQDAAARSIGLNRFQSLRYVVVPQAVRRVIPPLLNDFIGLQKDTALVSVLGVVEALQQTNIDTAATFSYTPYLCAAVLFLIFTIPLTRLTDWLIARDRKRRQAGGVR